MSKKKRKTNQVNLSKILPPRKTLTISRYTFPIWLGSYQGTNRDEWEERTCPYSTGEFIGNLLEQAGEQMDDMGIFDTKEIILKVLDGKYLEWLRETGRENTTESRCVYPMDRETAEELFVKYKYFRDYHLCALPLIVMCQEKKTFSQFTDFYLDENGVKGITEILETVFGAGNVLVFPYFLKPEEFARSGRRLNEMACTYFEEGKGVRYARWKNQENKRGVNLLHFALPIVVKGSKDKAYYTIDEFFSFGARDLPELVCLGKPDLDESGNPCARIEDGEDNMPEFRHEEIMEKLQPIIGKSFEKDGHISIPTSPYLIRFDEYPDYIMDEYETYEKTIKASGGTWKRI